MTLLVDKQIKALCEVMSDLTLKLDPFDDNAVQPSSIDLHLSDSYIIEGRKVNNLGSYIIMPLHFVLASTQEWVSLPDCITGDVCGVSTIGRSGLFIQNAGHVDPGFKGNLTLELFNASNKPIMLKYSQRICQMRFDMHASCRKPYSGRYQGQMEATAGRENV